MTNMITANSQTLLENNGFSVEYFNEKLYETLLVSVFYKIVTHYSKSELIKLKQTIMSCNSLITETLALKTFISSNLRTNLDDSQTQFILKLIKAYFRKSSSRVKLNNFDSLFKLQNGKCNICKRTIDQSAQIDHIIPWKFVGDEIDDNYQLLCNQCNSKKKANVFFEITYMISLGTISKI